ncbi:hypothetical protein JCM13591A_27070 [Microbacterium xylanilyticum]
MGRGSEAGDSQRNHRVEHSIPGRGSALLSAALDPLAGRCAVSGRHGCHSRGIGAGTYACEVPRVQAARGGQG